MRSLFTFIIFLFVYSFGQVYAQPDSVLFVNAKWKTIKISRGIVWKSIHFDSTLFHSNQSINILAIKKRKPIFKVGFERKILKETSKFGSEASALAAINGTFFDIKNGGSVDYIRSNGKEINESIPSKSGLAQHQKAAIVIVGGRLSLALGESLGWEKKISGEDIMTTGPLLLYESRSIKPDSSKFTFTRHPRTAIGITKRNILLLTVDGRDRKAAGMNLIELAQIMRWLGAKSAINLDGGGSTTLWIRNKGVVNYPSDDKKWGHEGERKVANVILVK
ncbi:MAG: phosphodiester glycosidase family protein [Bacteroidetes bacterium]|nr:phosphodiester glycosidase family protein [Bacteroidota bacterium]